MTEAVFIELLLKYGPTIFSLVAPVLEKLMANGMSNEAAVGQVFGAGVDHVTGINWDRFGEDDERYPPPLTLEG